MSQQGERDGVWVGSSWTVEEVGHERLSLLRFGALGDLLAQAGGVLLLQSHPANAGLWIRGGAAGRVAWRLDGVPLLGGMDGLAYPYILSLLDPGMVAGVAVFRGPASTGFGDKALAGAVALWSRDPALAKKGPLRFSGRLAGAYNSAAQAPVGQAFVSLAGRSWGLRLHGGVGWFQPRQGGGERGILEKSGYLVAHAGSKFLWRLGGGWSLRLMGLFGQASDIERDDLITTQGDRHKLFFRHYLASLALRGALAPGRTKLRLTLSFQRQERKQQIDHLTAGTRSTVATHTFVYPIHAAAAYLRGVSWLWSFLRVRYGTEWTLESVVTQSLQRQGQAVLQTDPLFTQASQFTAAAFLDVLAILFRRPLRVSLEGGTRIMVHWGQLAAPAPLSAVNWGQWVNSTILATRVRLPRWGQFVLLYSSGFRLPSLAERAGGAQQGPFFFIPNPNLVPEGSRSLEARLVFERFSRLRLSLRAFLQNWQSMITPAPAQQEGQEIVARRDVMRYENTFEATFWGAELAANLHIWRGWSARTGVLWLDLRSATPPRPPEFWPPMSPLVMRFSTRYQFGHYGGIEFFLRGALEQTARVRPRSITVSRPAPTYPGWLTLNVRGDLKLGRYLRLVVSLENLLSADYVVYGAQIFAPGRNIRLLLELSI